VVWNQSESFLEVMLLSGCYQRETGIEGAWPKLPLWIRAGSRRRPYGSYGWWPSRINPAKALFERAPE
jgi:hypothetical protein